MSTDIEFQFRQSLERLLAEHPVEWDGIPQSFETGLELSDMGARFAESVMSCVNHESMVRSKRHTIVLLQVHSLQPKIRSARQNGRREP